MLRTVPRTAAKRQPSRAEAGAPGPSRPAPAQPPSEDDAPSPRSPRAVIGAMPLQHAHRSKPDRLLRPPDGHAQDIVHLLNAGWFGPLSGPRAGLWDTDEPEAPLPPTLRRRSPPAAAAAKAAAGSAAAVAATSPSTSDGQRSGGSHGSGSDGGPAQLRPTLPQPILSQQAAQRQAQAAAVQELPGIGTWAGRYRLFGGEGKAKDAAAAAATAAASKQQQQPQEASLRGGMQQLEPQAMRRVCSEEAIERERGDEFGSPVVLRAAGFDRPAAPADGGSAQRGGGAMSSYNSDQAREDVWRWRFSRKWASEQQKYYEEQPASMASDDLDPLAFTQACGMGMNLQLMPAHATPRMGQGVGTPFALNQEGKPPLETSISNLSLFEVDPSYQMGLLGAEMSPGNSTHGAIAAAHALRHTTSNASSLGAAAPAPPPQPQHRRSQTWHAQEGQSPQGPSAMRSVLNMANKARDLLQKQGAIEAEVADRWERSRTAGDAWAGRDLEAIRIDTLGRFKYCVLRVSDGSGHTRFVVRGRRGASIAAVLQHAIDEVATASQAGSVPAASVEVVGEGMMEWREDTERELHLSPSTLPGDGLRQRSGNGDSPTKAPYLGDVSGLTASLVRQALPCHIRITTAADSRSASSAALGNNRI